MPPNRKGAFDTEQSLATLNVSQFVDTAKFQTLTAAPSVSSTQKPSSDGTTIRISTNDATEPVAVAVATVPTKVTPSADELANQAFLDRIVVLERLRALFSADHILEAIQQEQRRRPEEEEKEEAEVVHQSDGAKAEVDYWDMPTPTSTALEAPKVVHAVHNQTANYWDWPSTPKQHQSEIIRDETIRDILQEEKHRQLFMGEHIWANLQKAAAALNEKAADATPQQAQNDLYWQWDDGVDPNKNSVGSRDLSALEKASVIESIQADEEVRQLLSVGHIEANLKAADVSTPSATVSSATWSDDDYWAGF